MKIEMKIKEIRKEKNVTISELSKQSGVARSHICNIENGVKQPTLYVLLLLAKALNVKITELFVVHW